jgi:hypothetical protein
LAIAKNRLVYASISRVIAGNNKAGVLMEISNIQQNYNRVFPQNYFLPTLFFHGIMVVTPLFTIFL